MSYRNQTKAALRLQQKNLLKDISYEELVQAGEIIAEHVRKWLENNKQLIKHGKAALFHNLNDEVSTQALDSYLKGQNFEVCYPALSKQQSMHFFLPSTACCLSELDFIFVPGQAFDLDGWRLGRGQGFYDRALGAAKNESPCPLFIGLALDNQIVDKVPREPHDIPMNFICTPNLGVKPITCE